jgi:activator of HSP90 ATPase
MKKGEPMKTFVQKVLFKATPKEMYEIFMNPKKHSEATGGKATGNGKVGGSFTAWDGYIRGKNLALVPGRLVVQTWRNKEFKAKDHDSLFIVTLEKTSDGTLLTMTHTALPDHQSGVEKGWHDFYWTPIKKYLRHSK